MGQVNLSIKVKLVHYLFFSEHKPNSSSSPTFIYFFQTQTKFKFITKLVCMFKFNPFSC